MAAIPVKLAPCGCIIDHEGFLIKTICQEHRIALSDKPVFGKPN